MAKLCHLKIIKNNLISHVSACFYFYYYFFFFSFSFLFYFFLFSLLSPDFFSLGLRISPPLVFLSETPSPPKLLCLNLHRDRLPLVDLPYDTKMKNAKKKNRRARASNFNGKGIVATNVATNGEDEESKGLQALAEAFFGFSRRCRFGLQRSQRQSRYSRICPRALVWVRVRARA
jgi:hypothetical protein